MKRRTWILIGSTLLCSLVLLGFIVQPFNLNTIQNQPDEKPLKVYDYYTIIDEKTGAHLMVIPLVVRVGDEVITEDNKRFRVVKVVENEAYARFIEKVHLPSP